MTSEKRQSETTSGQSEADGAETGRVDAGQADTGQVDFYLLADPSLSADHLACRLAMMAWERRQQVFIVATTDEHLAKLDQLMWEFPPGRFLPHARTNDLAHDQNAKNAPVTLGLGSDLGSDANSAAVVINLCPEAIPQATRFDRILEIVPFVKEQRDASRTKYKNYLKLGLKPQTHEIT